MTFLDEMWAIGTLTDDHCPGCDERQARASALIEYLQRHPEENDPLGAAKHFLEDE